MREGGREGEEEGSEGGRRKGWEREDTSLFRTVNLTQ